MSAGGDGSQARPGISTDAGAEATRELRIGMTAALSAYLLWGFAVVFFKWVEHLPVWEIVANRIAWSVVFVGLFLFVRGRFGEVRAALATPKVRMALVVSTLLIATNWTVYIWAVTNAQVLPASFGYFINPLVNVLLGFLLLGERLTRNQSVAVGIAAVAVAIQALMLPGFPWISLTLAFSFGFYGYIRKLTPVGASPGLFIETAFLLPVALAYIAVLGANGEGHLFTAPLTSLQLALTGIVTALPLILFAVGARRLKLATIGLLQYLAPSIQFLLAVLVYGEPLSPIRFATFALIWLSLAIYTADSWRKRG
ncbi:MAG: EamA family transporter RarD [Hyphomicrobiales bacterium]|nr:MAG: EamA family transporter RarD [Hyphomicrobiales bacterium]